MRYITEKEYMELMEMLKTSFQKFDEQFADMHVQLFGLKKEMNDRFDKIDQRLDYLENRVERIEKNMVHKSQFNSLLIVLEKKKVINHFEKEHILQPV